MQAAGCSETFLAILDYTASYTKIVLRAVRKEIVKAVLLNNKM
jgi:hypothetical protein